MNSSEFAYFVVSDPKQMIYFVTLNPNISVPSLLIYIQVRSVLFSLHFFFVGSPSSFETNHVFQSCEGSCIGSNPLP